MNLRKEIKNVILPLLKASPILFAMVFLTILIARHGIAYLPEEYQSMGGIKINNLNSSQTGFDLFHTKNNNTPMQNETFLTEIEIFKSKNLIKKTIQQLDWEMSIYRVGEIRTKELYLNRPFQINYTIKKEDVYDKEFYLRYQGNAVFHLSESEESEGSFTPIIIGDTINLNQLSLQIVRVDSFLLENPNSLSIGDKFAFKINSLDKLASTVSSKSLFVRPVEKDISIIKIYYNHELPIKAQNFVDKLMNTYISESRVYKEEMSDETITYLEEQLNKAKKKLNIAESKLATYKTNNQLVNTRQETETLFREVAQLSRQNMDFDLQKSILDQLYQRLATGKSVNDYAPNFKALNNPVFQNSYTQLQALESERQDLAIQYTSESQEITNMNGKINTLRSFLNESVKTALDNLITQQQEIKQNINTNNNKVLTYPEKERKLAILERDVSLNENMYTYLMKKRTELEISRSSNLYPHKIIEEANYPKELIAPNGSLIIGLCVFLVLGFGILLVYIYHYFQAKINTKEDIEDALTIPLMGTVWQNKNNQFHAFEIVSGLLANIFRLPASDTAGEGKLLIVSSLNEGAGKSFVCKNLAQTIAASGLKTLLIDMDVRKPNLHNNWNLHNVGGVSAIVKESLNPLLIVAPTGEENLDLLPAGQQISSALLFSNRTTDFIKELRQHYEMIIIDAAPIGIVPDVIPLMQYSTANLFIVRAGHTKQRYASRIQECFSDWNIPNLQLILNGVTPSKKYIGYVGRNKERFSLNNSFSKN